MFLAFTPSHNYTSTSSSAGGRMTSPKPVVRLGFQETMALTRLPDDKSPSGDIMQKFISHTPAWKPGGELPWESLNIPASLGRKSLGPGAFGGHVYAQAPLAAAKVVEEEDQIANADDGKRSIHSIQGVFTSPGLLDRPYIYNVSTVFSSRSFTTRSVTVRQPTQPSSNPSGPFPASDADLDLNGVCFSCLVTFKRPVESPSDIQVPQSPQQRFAHILSQKAPDQWDPTPQADIDMIRDLFPSAGHGMFPILDMHKVDMRAYNADKALPDRRELIFYRLIKPLPREDVNAHILCHAFEADRNNLITLGNHLGYGYNFGTAASLSYSFYVHVNAEEAVMDGAGWWLQEVSFPRVSAGRGMIESKTWSPEGKHVASGYQDGIVMPKREKAERGKL
ncbi:Acyl-CoA thioesterase 2 [Paramyrothecium foliicola]|nr:Acyl-CoA thioesterase 2 [Paramyrothecium foliicola]